MTDDQWIAKFHRHGGEYTEEFNYGSEAYSFLEGSADGGFLSPYSITSPDGVETLYPAVGADEGSWEALKELKPEVIKCHESLTVGGGEFEDVTWELECVNTYPGHTNHFANWETNSSFINTKFINLSWGSNDYLGSARAKYG